MDIQHEHYHYEMFDQEIHPDLLNSARGSGEIDEIHSRMTQSYALTKRFNVAFGEYMRSFGRLKPDLFILTANSAVPVADAVRGWHEVTGTQPPELTYVQANRELAKETLTADQQRILEQDTKRLAKGYAGTRAVIVDQFVSSGSTLRLAHTMAENADITIVGSTPEAQWYNQAFGEIDLQNMTSEHVTFMRRVGRDAVHHSSDEYVASQWQ